MDTRFAGQNAHRSRAGSYTRFETRPMLTRLVRYANPTTTFSPTDSSRPRGYDKTAWQTSGGQAADRTRPTVNAVDEPLAGFAHSTANHVNPAAAMRPPPIPGWRLHDMRPTAIAAQPAANPTIAVIGDLAMNENTGSSDAIQSATRPIVSPAGQRTARPIAAGLCHIVMASQAPPRESAPVRPVPARSRPAPTGRGGG